MHLTAAANASLHDASTNGPLFALGIVAALCLLAVAAAAVALYRSGEQR